LFCSGEQYDSDLGLYYLRARYYNPVSGRFMSRDPENGIVTNPKTLHKYLYANGDPVNLKDPTGHEAMVATAELDFWGAVKNAAAVAAIGAGVACILSASIDLLKGTGFSPYVKSSKINRATERLPAGFCRDSLSPARVL